MTFGYFSSQKSNPTPGRRTGCHLSVTPRRRQATTIYPRRAGVLAKPCKRLRPAEGGHQPSPAVRAAPKALRKAFISPGLTDKKSTRQLRHRQNLRVVCFTGSQLDLSLLLLAFQGPHLYGAGKKRGQRAQAP